tara:strand:+ start:1467 stop:1724 length:258 start_codon:yes stop_codon:yes gene_type:complete
MIALLLLLINGFIQAFIKRPHGMSENTHTTHTTTTTKKAEREVLALCFLWFVAPSHMHPAECPCGMLGAQRSSPRLAAAHFLPEP